MEIECEFLDSGYYYCCKVTKAAITKSNVDIVSFRGKHQPGKSNDDVTKVVFKAARVECFPRNLLKIFPRLKSLTIQKCGLKEIHREDLIGLENLVYLNLNSNQLTSLADDLFSNMPKLKYVFLSKNKIEFASSKLIEPIVGNRLNYFYMSLNGSGCRNIQEWMAKIDEKCKPPTPQPPQPISMMAQHESVCESAEEIFKKFNEHRLLGRFAEAFEAFLAYLHERKLSVPLNAVEIFKLAAKYEVAKLKIICEKIIQENLDESNAFEIFKLACGLHKSEELKVAAFEKLQEKFGGELDAELINDPEKLQKIVRTKRLLDDLMNKTSAKKQRIV